MHFIVLIIRLCIYLKNSDKLIWYLNNSHVVVGGIQVIKGTVLVITSYYYITHLALLILTLVTIEDQYLTSI